MSRVVGFGDFLLRLSPPGYERFVQARRFDCYYTGAEANVCASLAILGCEASFVTRVPENPVAQAGLNELRRLGVDISHVVRGGDRLGVFYLEKGASQRPSLCVYDRLNSGVTTARRADYDWPTILRGAKFFHVTGITPGLGGELPQIVLDACRVAHRLGIQVICDLNYRSKLWSVEAAAKVLPSLVDQADHLIANPWDARNLLGVETGDDPVEASERLKRHFSRLQTVAMTFREAPTASDNAIRAFLHAEGRGWWSRRYEMHLVDRVGGGDAFAAGFVFSLVRRLAPQEAVEFAAAASCLKHSIERDVNLATEAEVWALVKGNGTGRVQR